MLLKEYESKQGELLQVPSLPCAAAPSAGPVAVASAVLTSGRCHGGGSEIRVSRIYPFVPWDNNVGLPGRVVHSA